MQKDNERYFLIVNVLKYSCFEVVIYKITDRLCDTDLWQI